MRSLPWPLAAGRCSLCSSVLTRRSPIGGSGCQGGDPGRSHGEARAPGLDAGASGDYLAWPFKDGKPQRPEAGQGSGPRACRPRRLPGHGKPSTAAPPAAQSPTSDRCPPAGRSAHHQRLTASKEPEGCGVFAKRRSPRQACPQPWAQPTASLPPGGGGVAKAKRPIDRVCHTGGIGSNTYLRFPSVPETVRLCRCGKLGKKSPIP